LKLRFPNGLFPRQEQASIAQFPLPSVSDRRDVAQQLPRFRLAQAVRAWGPLLDSGF
jgi:hypothetical protein